MLTPELKQQITEFVEELLKSKTDESSSIVSRDYIDSVQFALEAKSDRGHNHTAEEILAAVDSEFFRPKIELNIRMEKDTRLAEVCISKIRGYDMTGIMVCLHAEPMLDEEIVKAPLPLANVPFTTGELLYVFRLPVDRGPLRVQAFLRDLNDPELDVKTTIHVVTLVQTQEIQDGKTV